MAVWDHENYQQVKACRRTMRPLCDECRRYIGCPLPEARKHEQERPTLSNQGVNNGK